jgi:CPA2 family monovalent cation:H+ antiporter-2
MEHGSGFLGDLAVVLTVAAVSTVLFQRLRQPVVLGYLVAGLLIGPHVLGLGNLDTLHTLSELGVMLLMFSLGLEFGIRKLLGLGPRALMIGAVEVGLMLWLGFTAGRLFGFGVRESFFLGAILSISSTMIVAKTFSENPVERPVRDLVFSILVVEDVVAIAMIATLSAVAGGAALSAGAVVWNLGKLLTLLVVLVSVGLLVVPRFLTMALRTGNRESSLLATVGICFAGGLLAREFGYSVGLGAFLAGSLAAESGHSRSLEHLVRPIRDMFAAIFFVAVGMLIDPALIWQHATAIVVLACLVVVGKVVGVTLGSVLTGHGTQLSMRAGLSLTQIGEFSFMIAAVALPLGETARSLYPVAVAVCVLTSFTTPYIVRRSAAIASALDRMTPRAIDQFLSFYGTWLERMRRDEGEETSWSRLRRTLVLLTLDSVALIALVVATSLSMPRLLQLLDSWWGLPAGVGRVLVGTAAAVTAIPFLIGVFRCVRQLGLQLASEALPPGDLEQLGQADAPRRALVLGLQVTILTSVGLPILAFTQPFLPLEPGLYVLGLALLVVALLFWRTTRRLDGHVRAGTVMITDVLARQSQTAQPFALDHVQELFPGLGNLTLLRLEGSDTGVGHTLIELNLRGRSGASVLCISRGEEQVTPSGDDILLAGDVLVLTGPKGAIRAARTMLKVRGVEGDPPATLAG